MDVICTAIPQCKGQEIVMCIAFLELKDRNASHRLYFYIANCDAILNILEPVV